MRFAKITLTVLLASISVNAFPDEASDMQARIKEQMAAPDRHDWDLRRDLPRKPFETFQFLGLKEGMVAMDIGAYAGYTTEMLSAAVGPSGTVYMQNTQEVIQEYAEGYYERTIAERLANNRLSNVKLHVREYDDLGLQDEVELAFLGNLIHDIYFQRTGFLEDHWQPGPNLGSREEHLQALLLRHRHPPRHRRLHTVKK